MEGWDVKGALFRKVSPNFAARRKVLRRIVDKRNEFERYDRAFAKGVKDSQKMLYSLVFGSALFGGSMVMFYTRFFYVNNVLPGTVKILGFWLSGWVMADVVQVELVMKRSRERVAELAEKYALDADA